jgi:hypothetical protein
MPEITIHHNFKPDQFMWLWTKYVSAFNSNYHCTNCIKGPYSKKLSKASNKNLANNTTITLDEHDNYNAIYICGVSKDGYRQKENYTHNVHCVIEPMKGSNDKYAFEDWLITIENGRIMRIPEETMIPQRYLHLPKEYTTCRIFRWASSYYTQ